MLPKPRITKKNRYVDRSVVGESRTLRIQENRVNFQAFDWKNVVHLKVHLNKGMQTVVLEKMSPGSMKLHELRRIQLCRKLRKLSSIFDNSCKDICNHNEVVILTTVGRYRKIDVIYVKHPFFQQNLMSGTTTLKISPWPSANRSLRQIIHFITLFEKLLGIS